MEVCQRFRQVARQAHWLSRWTASEHCGTATEHGSPAGPSGASAGSCEVRAGLCAVCVVSSPPRRRNCQHNCFLPSQTELRLEDVTPERSLRV